VTPACCCAAPPQVLRYSNLFVWRDEHGRVWRDVIRASARSEFEVARKERDPELINRMIVTGRDAVSRTVEGFLRRRSRIVADEAAAADAGRGGLGSSHGGSGGSVR
jgi:Complex 1 protein (LYR family)